MVSKSARQTKKIAKELVEKILKNKNKQKQAFVIALRGDLGGGKTTFVQGLTKGLGIKEKITSPTFNIFKNYKLKNPACRQAGINYKLFYHFDCYRIEKSKEILDLGFKEIIQNPQNIMVIEWAEKIKKIIPKHALWISFDFIERDVRLLTFSSKKRIIKN